ncbi:prion-inhibition and propagation-domain-containing protein [Xylariaceae sp. AK1471]|nr:prion-inhibition and propagation-domain-containing protein [Xylariaceae sp. AK1471]
MEAAGLGIGVIGLVGLFSTCLDMVERWDSYKDFGLESESLRARLTADRVLFRQWGQKVGIGNDRREGDHHKALDDPSIRPAIDLVLRSIKNIEDDANTFASPLRHFSDLTRLSAEVDSMLHKDSKPFKKSENITSRRSRLGWALGGKARVLKLVASFEVLVQKLYDLVPPDPTIANGHMAAGGYSNSTASIGENSWHHHAQKILADLEKQIHNETRKEIIDWLEAPDSKRTYDDFIHRRLNGTCDWILERPEFLRWQSLASGDAKILWVNGPAGYGKTIISARIVKHISTNPETPLAYFFFSSEIESRADPFVVMRSWILRLMTQAQQAFDLTREKWEATDGRTASKHDIKELFNSIVQNLPHCMFVVDGLDECTVSGDVANLGHKDSLLEFLESLTHTMSKSQSRLLIVSRNDLRIREGLRIDSNEMEGELLELQIFPKDVETDATLYSQSIVSRKLGNKSEAQQEELSNRLVDRCQSMFLAIKLLEDDLRGGKNLKQLQRAIDQAPNKLNHIYDRNWGRIQNLEDTSRRRAFWILRWATFALRPLTVLEITECLLLPDGECDELDYEELPDSIDEIYVKTEILELCGSLIETRPGTTSGLGNFTIHLTHFSARQYILCHMPTQPAVLIAHEQLRSSSDSIQSNILAKACLRYLNCAQIWEETPRKENDSVIIQAFKAYAVDSWHQHVKLGVINSNEVIRLVNAFLRPLNPSWEPYWKYDISYCNGNCLGALRYDGAMDLGNPLYYASKFGLFETVDYLIEEMGLDVNHVDFSNRTALFAASASGYTSGTVKLLQKGANKELTREYEAPADGQHFTKPQIVVMLKQ